MCRCLCNNFQNILKAFIIVLAARMVENGKNNLPEIVFRLCVFKTQLFKCFIKKAGNHLGVITEGAAAPGPKHQITAAVKPGGPQNTADTLEEKGFQRYIVFMARRFTGMPQGRPSMGAAQVRTVTGVGSVLSCPRELRIISTFGEKIIASEL